MSIRSHRYAGLGAVAAPGFSVAEAAMRQRRFAYSEQRLMRLLASRVVSVPQRDLKALLARLQYEAALHAEGWRSRLRELRTSQGKLAQPPDAALTALFDEAEHLPGVYPFLLAVAECLKPALRSAYERYAAGTNPLADYPSVRLLRQLALDEEEHAELLAAALATLSPSDTERAEAEHWVAQLRLHLVAAGAIDGGDARGPAPERIAPAEPFQIAHELTRDATLPRVWDYSAPALDDVPAHLDYMMALRLSEINVAEGLAIVLYETTDMPWSFTLDIARHCWDEMRHSLFGEAAIEATHGDRAMLPLRDYEGVFAMEAPPLEQYAVLGLEVEGKNMRYPPGKRQEWEFARDLAQHPLMTTFQDFDWADEVLHVNIARRQLDVWFPGGLAQIASFAQRGKAHRTAVKQRHAPVALPRTMPPAPED